jgi:hypothetical protein
MTIGYYTGTSTGPNDLIDKLRIALLSEGWTVDGFTTIGAGYRLHIHKTLGGEVSYFNFRSAIAETGTTLICENNAAGTAGTVTGLLINGSTGYDAGQVWHKQTGYAFNPYSSNQSFAMCMTEMSISAIPAYYFYFVEDSVHIVVETTAGKFQMMSFGMLSKQGTYTGGQYFTASHCAYNPYDNYYGRQYYWRDDVPRYFTYPYGSETGCLHGAVYLDDVTATWKIAYNYINNPITFPCPAGNNGNSYGSLYTFNGLAAPFYTKSPSSYNSMAAMCPIYILRKRADNNQVLLGWPEGVRFLNVTNYSPGEEITYGSETWMVFPSNGINLTPYYPYCGFAFLKDDGS